MTQIFSAALLVAGLLFSGCSSCNGGGGGSDASTSTDADTDTDSDTDTDTDTDSDTDTDTDSDIDTDTDTDTDSDGGTDADTDTDSDWVPAGCDVISTHASWMVERGFSEGRMTWIDTDTPSEMPEIRVRELSTGDTTILVDETPSGYFYRTAIWGDWVYWEWRLDVSDSYSVELFRKNIVTNEQQQLTNTSCSSMVPLPGEAKIVFIRHCDGDAEDIEPMYLLDLGTLEAQFITNDALGNPGGYDFDGTQWLVWLDAADVTEINWLWKYDVLNGVGPTVAQNGMTEIVAPKIFDGTVYYSAWDSPSDPIDKADVRTHDLASGTNSWLFNSPWDQVQVSTAGRVAAYADTETLAHNWFEDQTVQIELYDLDTGATRQVTEVAFEYFGIARHDKYLAYLAGDDVLILCDLEAGGFIGADGHVCPEEGCPEIDAGLDGGE